MGRVSIHRPGPARILPDQAPGGVVVHVYAIPTEELLTTSVIPLERLAVAGAVERAAEAAAEVAAQRATSTCLVAYDGDSGERMPWTL
jgi:hypothetical protein